MNYHQVIQISPDLTWWSASGDPGRLPGARGAEGKTWACAGTSTSRCHWDMMGICPLVTYVYIKRTGKIHHFIAGQINYFDWVIFYVANCECFPEGSSKTWGLIMIYLSTTGILKRSFHRWGFCVVKTWRWVYSHYSPLDLTSWLLKLNSKYVRYNVRPPR